MKKLLLCAALLLPFSAMADDVRIFGETGDKYSGEVVLTKNVPCSVNDQSPEDLQLALCLESYNIYDYVIYKWPDSYTYTGKKDGDFLAGKIAILRTKWSDA